MRSLVTWIVCPSRRNGWIFAVIELRSSFKLAARQVAEKLTPKRGILLKAGEKLKSFGFKSFWRAHVVTSAVGHDLHRRPKRACGQIQPWWDAISWVSENRAISRFVPSGMADCNFLTAPLKQAGEFPGRRFTNYQTKRVLRAHALHRIGTHQA